MSKNYHQFHALWALTKASFIAMLRSPSTIVFSLGFPLIFILGFALLDSHKKGMNIKMGFDVKSDTTSTIYKQIQQTPGVQLIVKNNEALKEDVKRNRIEGIIYIAADSSINIVAPEYAAHQDDLSILQKLLSSIPQTSSTNGVEAKMPGIEWMPGKRYKTIDFILPGQLGFALLGASVFGVAFLFFNLRQELVLKRFFATPISKTFILLGETLSRTCFQLIAASMVILVGVLLFDFTLIHGWWTFIQIIILCFIALIVFMGYGFIVSGLAKSASAVPALANIFVLPQFILAGTFFPIDLLPKWLQPICQSLPLAHFNEAMRSISFDGASLWDCAWHILIISLWGMVIYLFAVRCFKWA